MTLNTVDREALEQKVKSMYSDVALNPHGEFHFEMGQAMAVRLGYAPADLACVPAEAIDSFAGVGHLFTWRPCSPVSTSSTLAADQEWTASSLRSRWASPGESSAWT